MSEQTCLINLDHPCRGVDIWMANNAEEVQIGRGQGYVPLEELRQMKARIAELERQLAQRTGKVQRVAHPQLDAMLQTPQYDPLWA